MRLKALAAIGIIVMAAMGALIFATGSSDPEPTGSIASDSVTTAVGGMPVSTLTGLEWGLVAGFGLLIISLGLHLVQRSRDTKSASTDCHSGEKTC